MWMGFIKRLSPQQSAAMRVGIGLGSTIAVLGLPSRQTFADISSSGREMAVWLQAAGIDSAGAGTIIDGMKRALAEPNTVTAGAILMGGANRLKDSLPDALMRCYRIGVFLGFSIEMATVIKAGNPGRAHLDTFAALTAQYGNPIPDDLLQSGLPDGLQEAVRATMIRPNSPSDLDRIISACRNVMSSLN
jgi:hypothetical protein